VEVAAEFCKAQRSTRQNNAQQMRQGYFDQMLVVL
jgi:hypothetical protein